MAPFKSSLPLLKVVFWILGPLNLGLSSQPAATKQFSVLKARLDVKLFDVRSSEEIHAFEQVVLIEPLKKPIRIN